MCLDSASYTSSIFGYRRFGQFGYSPPQSSSGSSQHFLSASRAVATAGMPAVTTRTPSVSSTSSRDAPIFICLLYTSDAADE